MHIECNLSFAGEASSVAHQAIPLTRYFNFLNEKDAHIGCKDRYIASRKTGNQLFLEVKYTTSKDWHFTLQPTAKTFWMAFHFIGTTILNYKDNKTILSHQQYTGFFEEEDRITCHIRSGKVWMVLIGTEIENTVQLGLEWKTLAPNSDVGPSALPILKINFRNKRILEHIQQIKDTPFSSAYKLQYYTICLMETLHGDLLEHAKSAQRDDISLFHRAKEYIMAHYMDEDIDIGRMAQELLTSERTLYRIFQDNGLTVNSAIQAIRIHKGREMLRKTDESVDMIAFHLQFSTAKYFIKQYVKYFGHTPAMERKMISRRQLGNYDK